MCFSKCIKMFFKEKRKTSQKNNNEHDWTPIN